MERQRIRLDLDGRLIATAEAYTVIDVRGDRCDIELTRVQPIDHEAVATLAAWTWRGIELIVDHGLWRQTYTDCSWRAFSYDGEFQGMKTLRYRITANLPEESSTDRSATTPNEPNRSDN